eukprot:2045907-Ditylum_brightwellii.AAC.1
MQNKCVDDDNGDGVDNSDDSADKHLTHLSPAVDCCLTERSDLNRCVNDSKEGVYNNDDDSVVDSDDGGDMHLTHLTQVKTMFLLVFVTSTLLM